MSYNIRLDVASDGINAWPYRRKELIGQVALIRPDIIGMQEVVPGQRRDLVTALPDYAFLGVARDDGRDSGEYSLLGIRRAAFRTIESGTFWLSETPDRPSKGWDASYRRIVTWARLKDRRTGTPFLVLNTHWDNDGRKAREQSASLLADWITRHRTPQERLLLLGDFNAPLAEASLQRLLASGLRDARGSDGFGPSATFNNFRLVPPAAEPIDHILVGSRWSVSRFWTVTQHVEGRPVSDHYPIVADLVAGCLTRDAAAANNAIAP